MQIVDPTPTPCPAPVELVRFLALEPPDRTSQLWAWADEGLVQTWREVGLVVSRAMRVPTDDPVERVLLLRLAAECAHHASDNVRAVELSVAAESLVEQNKIPAGLQADLLYHRGSAHFRLCDSARALACGVDMLRIAGDAELFRQQMYAHTLLGNVYFGAEQYKQALDHFMKSGQFADRCDDRDGRFRALFNEVWIHIELDDGETALARCDELLTLGRLMGGERQPMAHVKTAAVQVHLGLLDEAEPNVRAALGRAMLMRPMFQLQALSIQAGLHLKRGRLKAARRVDEQLVALAEESVNPRLQSTAMKRLAETCAEGGDFEAAYRYHVRFHAVEKANTSDASEHRLRSLEVMLRLSQAEADAAAFRAEIVALSEANQGLEDVRAELMRKSLEDPLTGLPNRRALDAALEAAVRDAETKDRPMALLVLDMDHFKRVNDDYSHLVGDDVLRTFATLLNQVIRGQDFAGRFGGEEFVALLAGVGPDRAQQIAERIRLAVKQHDWSSAAEGLAVTVSGGLSVWTPGDTPKSLLTRADLSLYCAKSKGRDQICGPSTDES